MAATLRASDAAVNSRAQRLPGMARRQGPPGDKCTPPHSKDYKMRLSYYFDTIILAADVFFRHFPG
jgi:hypothetical protein